MRFFFETKVVSQGTCKHLITVVGVILPLFNGFWGRRQHSSVSIQLMPVNCANVVGLLFLHLLCFNVL